MTEEEIQSNLGKGRDLRNQKFGRLIPLYPISERKNGHIVWHCLCECGNECDISSNHLKNGHSKSCGCLQKESSSIANSKNLLGKKFGRLTVLNKTDKREKRHIIWQCQCDCGKL